MPGHDPIGVTVKIKIKTNNLSVSHCLCAAPVLTQIVSTWIRLANGPSDKLSCFVLPFSCCFFWCVCPTLEYERRLLALFLKPPVCVLVSFDLIFLQTAVLHFSLVLSGWPEDILKPVPLWQIDCRRLAVRLVLGTFNQSVNVTTNRLWRRLLLRKVQMEYVPDY